MKVIAFGLFRESSVQTIGIHWCGVKLPIEMDGVPGIGHAKHRGADFDLGRTAIFRLTPKPDAAYGFEGGGGKVSATH